MFKKRRHDQVWCETPASPGKVTARVDTGLGNILDRVLGSFERKYDVYEAEAALRQLARMNRLDWDTGIETLMVCCRHLKTMAMHPVLYDSQDYAMHAVIHAARLCRSSFKIGAAIPLLSVIRRRMHNTNDIANKAAYAAAICIVASLVRDPSPSCDPVTGDHEYKIAHHLYDLTGASYKTAVDWEMDGCIDLAYGFFLICRDALLEEGRG